MNWPEHSFIGFVLFFIIGLLLFGYNYLDTQLIILSCFSAFSALVPDIDHHQSKLRQHLNLAVPAVSFVFFFVRLNDILMAVNYTLLVSLAYFLFFQYIGPRHRGITHTLIFVALYGAVIYFALGLQVGIAGAAGYLSHLVADREIKVI